MEETDILLYKSENQTDEFAGGGRMSADTVDCGQPNNIFPNLSRLGRLTGEVKFRKTFLRIDTDTTEVYSGAHICLKKIPDDPSVGIVLFECQSPSDREKWNETIGDDFKAAIENYYTQSSSAGDATNASALLAGEKVICFLISDVSMYKDTVQEESGGMTFEYTKWVYSTDLEYTLNINIGDIIYLSDGDNSEYAIVTKVNDDTTILVDDGDNYQAVSYRYVYLMETLQFGHDAAAISVYTTVVNESWKSYGTVQLAVDAAVDATTVYVDSTKVRLIPKVGGATVVDEFYPLPPPTSGGEISYDEINLTVETQNPYFSEAIPTSPGQSIYVCNVAHTPIKPGSVWVLMRSQGEWVSLNDDGAGSLAGSGTGSYTETTINIQYWSSVDPDDETHILVFYQTSSMFQQYDAIAIWSGGSLSLPCDIDLRKQNIYPGSILLSLRSTSGKYRIRDDGKGNLIPDPDMFMAESGVEAGGKRSYADIGRAEYIGMSTVAAISGNYGWTTGDGSTWGAYGYKNFESRTEDVRETAYSDSPYMLYMAAGTNGVFYKEAPGDNATQSGLTNSPSSSFFIEYDRTHNCFISAPVGTTPYKRTVGDYKTWEDVGNNLGVSNMLLCWGKDDTGTGMVLAVNDTGSKCYRTFDAGDTWELCPLTAGGTVFGIVYDDSARTFMVHGSKFIYRTQDGGQTWDNLSLPSGFSGRAVSGLAANGSGVWFGCCKVGGIGNPHAYVCMSQDNGDTWGQASWTCSDSTRGTFVERVHTVYMPHIDKFMLAIWVDSTVSSGYDGVASSLWEYSSWPANPAGAIDCLTGTGQIAYGESLNATPVAQFFLREIYETAFALPLAGAENIIADTLIINATAVSDNRTLEIREDNGQAVGDGTWELFHEPGYVLVDFIEPIKHGSIRMSFEYESMAGVNNFADLDASRFPANGFVPGFQENDVIVIRGITDPDTADMAVVTEVTKNSISFANPLSHSYQAGDAIISNAIVIGDIAASVGVVFTQSTWDGSTWSDDQIGPPADGEIDTATHPITVTNRGAEKQRWIIEIKTDEGGGAYTVDVIGEDLGIVAAGLLVGAGGSDIKIENPNTTAPSPDEAYYFLLSSAAFGEGLQVGNILRINTEEAGYPFWTTRVVNAQTSDTATDDFLYELRGDTA